MSADEQRMREQFEEWVAVRFPWLLESAPEFKPNGEYRFAPLRLRFEAWQGAYCSRDAEVQRLLTALTNMFAAFDDPFTTAQVEAHQSAVMLLAEYLPEKEEANDAD